MTPSPPSSDVDFTLFVPCLNEAPRVEGTLETVRVALQQIGRSYEVLVVDDGSSDGTSAVVERYRAQHPEMTIHLHRNPVNCGVAYSFVEAAFRGRGEYFRLIWGDNTEPVETQVRILSLAGQVDVVIPYYPDVAGKSAFRLALSRCYTGLVNGLSGFKVRYYNGSVLCRRYQAMRWSPHNHGFTGFLADLITQLLAEGATYTEVAVVGVHVEKDKKATPLTFHNLFSTGLTLIGIFTRRLSYAIYRRKLGRLNPKSPTTAATARDAVAIRCHVCAGSSIDPVAGYEAFHRVTSDCKPWPAGGRLCVCRTCGCIQKVIDQAWRSEVAQIYDNYTIYYQSGGVEQAVFDQNSGQAVRRSNRVLQHLQANAELPKHGRLLDVGCGNGALLRAFSSLIPGWSLVGTELSDKYRLAVEAIPGVEAFYACPPGEIPGSFDLIIVMHALEHIPAPADFLVQLRGKLAAGGLLIVEVPDHLQNPFDLLIADHSTHFTAATIAALIESAGYRLDAMATDWMPKELTALARRGEGRSTQSLPGASMPGIVSAPRSLAWLRSVIAAAREVATAGNFGLFGSSIAATWLASELGEAVDFFVDEDPSRLGKTHMGKPIYHPRDVPAQSHVFITLPAPLARDVALRLEKSHPACTYHLPPAFPGQHERHRVRAPIESDDP